MLSLFIAGISSVLADEHDAVHGKLSPAERESFSDGRINLHRRKARRTLAAEVVIPDLVHVKRDQVHGRMMMLAVPPVAFEKPVDDVLRVRELMVSRGDRGELGPRILLGESRQ